MLLVENLAITGGLRTPDDFTNRCEGETCQEILDACTQTWSSA